MRSQKYTPLELNRTVQPDQGGEEGRRRWLGKHFFNFVRIFENLRNLTQSCMTFTKKIIVAKISAKIKLSGNVIQFIY